MIKNIVFVCRERVFPCFVIHSIYTHIDRKKYSYDIDTLIRKKIYTHRNVYLKIF